MPLETLEYLLSSLNSRKLQCDFGAKPVINKFIILNRNNKEIKRLLKSRAYGPLDLTRRVFQNYSKSGCMTLAITIPLVSSGINTNRDLGISIWEEDLVGN